MNKVSGILVFIFVVLLITSVSRAEVENKGVICTDNKAQLVVFQYVGYWFADDGFYEEWWFDDKTFQFSQLNKERRWYRNWEATSFKIFLKTSEGNYSHSIDRTTLEEKRELRVVGQCKVLNDKNDFFEQLNLIALELKLKEEKRLKKRKI